MVLCVSEGNDRRGRRGLDFICCLTPHLAGAAQARSWELWVSQGLAGAHAPDPARPQVPRQGQALARGWGSQPKQQLNSRATVLASALFRLSDRTSPQMPTPARTGPSPQLGAGIATQDAHRGHRNLVVPVHCFSPRSGLVGSQDRRQSWGDGRLARPKPRPSRGLWLQCLYRQSWECGKAVLAHS